MKKHRWTHTVLHNPFHWFDFADMKYQKICTPERDAVCTCDEGYNCSDSKCEMCVKVRTYTTSPSPAFTRSAQHTQSEYLNSDALFSACYIHFITIYIYLDCCGISSWQTVTHTVLYWPVYSFSLLLSIHLLPFYQPLPDNVWISVSLCFACVCVCVLFTCFLLISRHARPCGWIMSASIGQCHYNSQTKPLKCSLYSCMTSWYTDIPMHEQYVSIWAFSDL